MNPFKQVQELARASDASYRTRMPVAYALRLEFLIRCLPVAVVVELLCLVIGVGARDLGGWTFKEGFLGSSFVATGAAYLGWRTLVMERRLDYRHVFPARRLYRFAYIVGVIGAISAIHLLNCMFVDPSLYILSLAPVLIASIELHVSLREEHEKSIGQSDASAASVVIGIGMLLAWGGVAGAVTIGLLFLPGVAFVLFLLLAQLGLVVGTLVMFRRYCVGIREKDPASALVFQMVLLWAVLVTLLTVGTWLLGLGGVFFTLYFLASVGLFEVIFLVGEPAILGPRDK